ncbi:DNA methyltransferase [Pseudomonas moorei]|uniref:site-specific DNA-methyltransferase (cytosine-N(4)-specific) n=1 Tax=Pseudomonas moorei TaxID=395599 RepID=A0A1H1EW90_9PSED|nr:DNA methyltransferase [Pseudomonas moorei]SDQ92933.1 DNA methylase [Pseudomonas moorei]
MFDSLIIDSPKRKVSAQSKLKDFFPYYAGFPESFAKSIIGSTSLKTGAVVLDPWNGSGTTTTAALKLGFHTCGIDINPVMVMVARARNLQAAAVDLLEAEAKKIFQKTSSINHHVSSDDPLLQWFDIDSTLVIRQVEQKARTLLIRDCGTLENMELNKYSCLASNLYVALFNACRVLTKPFRSTNPTWLRLPKENEHRLSVTKLELKQQFFFQLSNVVASLRESNIYSDASTESSIIVGDSTTFIRENYADLILTSPPYCTRIDYTAATRIELALIAPLLGQSRDELSRKMIGSIKVPKIVCAPDINWGETCNAFIDKLRNHSSKASAGYYYKSHIDYFSKMARSMRGLAKSLKSGGGAVLVVQDSYYKDIHNDVASIVTEMAQFQGLTLFRREDFAQRNSMSGINTRSRKYNKPTGSVESVICFLKKN